MRRRALLAHRLASKQRVTRSRAVHIQEQRREQACHRRQLRIQVRRCIRLARPAHADGWRLCYYENSCLTAMLHPTSVTV